MSTMKFPSMTNRWLMPRRPQTPDWASIAMGTRTRMMERRSVRVISNARAKRMRIGREGTVPLARSSHKFSPVSARALVRSGVTLGIGGGLAHPAPGRGELLGVEGVIPAELVGTLVAF